MMHKKHFLDAWRKNSPPPPDRLDLYDNFLVLEIETGLFSLAIKGFVSWDSELHEYVFHFLEHLSGPVYQVGLGRAVYEADVYLTIRHILRDGYKIFTTSGIHDRQEPYGQTKKSTSFLVSGPAVTQ